MVAIMMKAFAIALAVSATFFADPPVQATVPAQTYKVVDNAIFTPLTDVPGDAARGRAIVEHRQVGMCLLCHGVAQGADRSQGNLAPPLTGVGARATTGQLRLRLVDSRRLNPDSIMPAYFATDGFTRVSAAWQAKTILDAQQIEDVIAYLETLK